MNTNTISHFLGTDHARCDTLFAQIQSSAKEQSWEQAKSDFRNFKDALERHLMVEETILFPAFESATGILAGPTAILRVEHEHIRLMIIRIEEAVEQQDVRVFFDHADTLTIIMGQHNQKEESILYFTTDRVLSDKQEEILQAMGKVTGNG